MKACNETVKFPRVDSGTLIGVYKESCHVYNNSLFPSSILSYSLVQACTKATVVFQRQSTQQSTQWECRETKALLWKLWCQKPLESTVGGSVSAGVWHVIVSLTVAPLLLKRHIKYHLISHLTHSLFLSLSLPLCLTLSLCLEARWEYVFTSPGNHSHAVSSARASHLSHPTFSHT